MLSHVHAVTFFKQNKRSELDWQHIQIKTQWNYMHCFFKAYYDVNYFYFHLRKSNQMDTTVHCVEHQLTQKIIFIILFAYNILLSDGIDMCTSCLHVYWQARIM